MKKYALICMLSLSILSFLSCEALFRSLGGIGGSGPSFPAEPPPATPPFIDPNLTVSAWGVVGCASPEASHIQHFQTHARSFLSSFMDIKTLGYIGCTAKDAQAGRGGFYFKGEVSFEEDAKLNPSVGATQYLTPVADKSYIELHISTTTATPIKAFKMTLPPAGGKVENQYISLSFEDDKGSVNLIGQIDSKGFFAGEFSYENFVNYDGVSDAYSGTVGVFKIASCSFFKCF